jgi:hypothetical protein
MRQVVESNNWQVAIGVCAAALAGSTKGPRANASGSPSSAAKTTRWVPSL